MKRLNATISGLVQGVSYRYYTRREATRLGITGWVRNERDGSVQVVAEGDEDLLVAFRGFLERGSPAARVAAVKSSWSPATGEFNSFDVYFR
jgi:acylphosphatase